MQEQDATMPLSASTTHLPIQSPQWALEPVGDGDLAEIAELKKLMAESGVEGPHVAKLFMERRCQPLKNRKPFWVRVFRPGGPDSGSAESPVRESS
jgi:hypothetical protein